VVLNGEETLPPIGVSSENVLNYRNLSRVGVMQRSAVSEAVRVWGPDLGNKNPYLTL